MERGGNARAKAEDAIFDRVTEKGNVTAMVGEDSRVTGSGSATRMRRVVTLRVLPDGVIKSPMWLVPFHIASLQPNGQSRLVLFQTCATDIAAV
jgi:hypothetical protein